MADSDKIVLAEIPKRSTLEGFYRLLLAREKKPQVPLIAKWDPSRRKSITEALSAEFKRDFVNRDMAAEIAGFVEANPQSRGHRVASYFRKNLKGDLGYWFEQPDGGAGYPDYILAWENGGWCCAELKTTTSEIGAVSSLRAVLTGSTNRILKCIAKRGGTPTHLIITLRYQKTGAVLGLDLDFLEPDIPVDIKLEASTSQKLLAERPDLRESIEL